MFFHDYSDSGVTTNLSGNNRTVPPNLELWRCFQAAKAAPDQRALHGPVCVQ
jgi:hypothetical protein